MTSVDLLEKKQTLKDEAINIINTAKMEIRMLNGDENQRFAEIKEEINNINEEIRNLDVELPKVIENQINTENKINHNIMTENFSILRAVKAVAENRALDAVSQAVVDNGAAEMRNAGISYNGQIVIPTSEEYRTITVTTEHDDVIKTDVMDVLTALHGKNALIQSGVKFLTNLKGDVMYPIMSEANSYWCDETADCSTSTPVFASVRLAPHRISCVIPISKQFLLQDSISAENAIRSEIINSINGLLESTILGTAAASTTKPGGLLNGVLADVSTFAGLCDKESDIEGANFDNLGYICDPKAKAILRGMNKGGNTAASVWNNGEIDGVPCITTTNVGVQKGIVVADWSQFVLAQFGGIEILVDPYSLAGQGITKLVASAYFDFKPLRDGAYKAFKMA